ASRGLGDERNRPFRRQPSAAGEELGEALALDVLHHEVRLAVLGRPGVEDADDVRVREARGELHLPQEAPARGLVGGETGVEGLQRDRPAELDVLGELDGRHPAASERSLYAVPAQSPFPPWCLPWPWPCLPC